MPALVRDALQYAKLKNKKWKEAILQQKDWARGIMEITQV